MAPKVTSLVAIEDIGRMVADLEQQRTALAELVDAQIELRELDLPRLRRMKAAIERNDRDEAPAVGDFDAAPSEWPRAQEATVVAPKEPEADHG